MCALCFNLKHIRRDSCSLCKRSGWRAWRRPRAQRAKKPGGFPLLPSLPPPSLSSLSPSSSSFSSSQLLAGSHRYPSHSQLPAVLSSSSALPITAASETGLFRGSLHHEPHCRGPTTLSAWLALQQLLPWDPRRQTPVSRGAAAAPGSTRAQGGFPAHLRSEQTPKKRKILSAQVINFAASWLLHRKPGTVPRHSFPLSKVEEESTQSCTMLRSHSHCSHKGALGKAAEC